MSMLGCLFNPVEAPSEHPPRPPLRPPSWEGGWGGVRGVTGGEGLGAYQNQQNLALFFESWSTFRACSRTSRNMLRSTLEPGGFTPSREGGNRSFLGK